MYILSQFSAGWLYNCATREVFIASCSKFCWKCWVKLYILCCKFQFNCCKCSNIRALFISRFSDYVLYSGMSKFAMHYVFLYDFYMKRHLPRLLNLQVKKFAISENKVCMNNNELTVFFMFKISNLPFVYYQKYIKYETSLKPWWANGTIAS